MTFWRYPSIFNYFPIFSWNLFSFLDSVYPQVRTSPTVSESSRICSFSTDSLFLCVSLRDSIGLFSSSQFDFLIGILLAKKGTEGIFKIFDTVIFIFLHFILLFFTLSVSAESSVFPCQLPAFTTKSFDLMLCGCLTVPVQAHRWPCYLAVAPQPRWPCPACAL